MPEAQATGGGGTHDEAFKEPLKKQIHTEVEKLVERTLGLFPEGTMMPQSDMKRHVWKLAFHIHDKLKPDKEKRDPMKEGICAHLWGQTKYMLRQLIDFDGFNADPSRSGEGVLQTSESEVVRVLQWFQTYLATGEVVTKFERPHIVFEGDDVVAVDKPAGFLCSFGAGVPKVARAPNATELLNANGDSVQIHEWIALTGKFECANKTREFWATNPTCLPCTSPIPTEGGCQECPGCGYAIAGVANRLDRETSGIVLAAKTGQAFTKLRSDFGNKGQSKMEKHYLALVHGKMDSVSEGWRVTHLALKVSNGKSVPWTEEDDKMWEDMEQQERSRLSLDDSRKRQAATTYYRPLAQYQDDDGDYTLMHFQIVTGRRHQIRFHSSQLGYPLVGDVAYGAPEGDRERFGRIFLHSYRTRFREPIKGNCWEVVAPLPATLVKVLADLAKFGGQSRLHAPEAGPLDPATSDETESALVEDKRTKPIQILGRCDPGVLAPLVRQVGRTEKLYSHLAPWGEVAPEPSPAAPQALGPPSATTPLPASLLNQPVEGMPGWFRRESRNSPGEFYMWNPETGETRLCGPVVQAVGSLADVGEPVPDRKPWRLCRSKKNPLAIYYWNPETLESVEFLPPKSVEESSAAPAPAPAPASAAPGATALAPSALAAADAAARATLATLGTPGPAVADGVTMKGKQYELVSLATGQQILYNHVSGEAMPLDKTFEANQAKRVEKDRRKAAKRTRSSRPPARSLPAPGGVQAAAAPTLHPSGSLGSGTTEGLLGIPRLEPRRGLSPSRRHGKSLPRLVKSARFGTPRRKKAIRALPRRAARGALDPGSDILSIDLTLEDTPPAKRECLSDSLAVGARRRWATDEDETIAGRVVSLLEQCRLENPAKAVQESSALRLFRMGVTFADWSALLDA